MSIFDSIPEQEERIERVIKGERKQAIADWIAVKSGQYTQDSWNRYCRDYINTIEEYQSIRFKVYLNEQENYGVVLPTYTWVCSFVDKSQEDGRLEIKLKYFCRNWNFVSTVDGLWHARGDIVLYNYDEESLPFFIEATHVFLINSSKIIPYLNQNHIPYEKMGID